jgi:hypothetical protein
MELLHTAFLAKSFGGTDNLGNRWKPLAHSTNIYKPLVSGEASSYGVRQFKALRGLLTPSQDRLWRRIFASVYRSNLAKLGDAEAKQFAARVAWDKVKAAGGKTKKDVFANRKTQINVRTGRLLRACTPGRVSNDTYVPPNIDQEVTVVGDTIRVFFRIPYAEAVNDVRPIIPANHDAWIREAARYANMMVSTSQRS